MDFVPTQLSLISNHYPLSACYRIFEELCFLYTVMDPEAARNARESLELAFQMSNILATGLDRHTLSILIALCDRGLNPEALAALVRELRNESHSRDPAYIPCVRKCHMQIDEMRELHFLHFHSASSRGEEARIAMLQLSAV